MIQNRATHKNVIIENSVDSSGNFVVNSKNLKSSFDCNKMQDGKYNFVGLGVKDVYDAYQCGAGSNDELIYDSHAISTGYNIKFSHLCYDNSFIEYCDLCQNSENLFGCIGIKKGSYCILNKEYSKENFFLLKEKIINEMQKRGEYGQFFPINISPFAYNETQTQVYMPLSKEEVLNQKSFWKEDMGGVFGQESISVESIPDTIKDIKDDFVQNIIKCSKSGKNFKIVKQELFFYKKNNIPIPRLHPEERCLNRVKILPGRRLYKTECKNCHTSIESSYSPDRPEIVYCEKCYQNEIY